MQVGILFTFAEKKKPGIFASHRNTRKKFHAGIHSVKTCIPVVMKTKIIYILLTAFVLFSLVSCKGSKKKNDGKNSTVAVSFIEGYIVKPSTVDETILISGTLRAFEETVLMPEVSGRVVALNLPEGQFVKKGANPVGDCRANTYPPDRAAQG